MPTAVLKFNLDDQDDKLAHKRACNADNAYLVLAHLRDELDEEGQKQLFWALDHYDVNLEDLP